MKRMMRTKRQDYVMVETSIVSLMSIGIGLVGLHWEICWYPSENHIEVEIRRIHVCISGWKRGSLSFFIYSHLPTAY